MKVKKIINSKIEDKHDDLKKDFDKKENWGSGVWEKPTRLIPDSLKARLRLFRAKRIKVKTEGWWTFLKGFRALQLNKKTDRQRVCDSSRAYDIIRAWNAGYKSFSQRSK